MFKQLFVIATAVAVVILAGSFAAFGATMMTFETHEIEITLDVPNHSAALTDRGTVRVANGWNLFMLGSDINIESLSINDRPVEFVTAPITDILSLPAGAGPLPADIDTTGRAQLVLFESTDAGEVTFEIVYGGTFYQDVSNIRFSNEKVGTEVTGTISDQGAYLSSSAYFYPCGDEEMASFKLSALIPGEWESISDGNRLDSENVEGRKLQTWENPYPSDGVTFFASAFQIGQAQAGDVWVYCYFFPEDSQLIDGYLRATVDYISMYEELIGPYPYKRFTVVDNFFPTGYGMPGWTLLGQQVLRLPFIVGTSLGHEVLHNWWGNSVFVDYESGNWCEGLTVYGADYRYKLLRSPEEARDYRKDILKQYVSYITEANDFPLREFTARSDPGTRTIGYNKSMMVFHMIEELIGPDAFSAAMKNIYKECRGHKVSWEDWIAAFEKTSAMDLSFVITQWIDRAGAPVLAAKVEKVQTAGNESGNSDSKGYLELKLEEVSGQNYRLEVPVRISGVPLRVGAMYVIDKTVSLEGGQGLYRFDVDVKDFSTELEVEIDPDYHLFRKLYPEEVEPVVSAILGNPMKQFIYSGAADDAVAFFGEFGLNMTGDSVKLLSSADAGSTSGSFAVLLTEGELPDYLARVVTLTADSVIVAGASYGRQGHTFVLTGNDWTGFEKYMVVLTSDYASLPRIGQLAPHYGKYSYLVFEGPRNIDKGQWEPESSPLKIKVAQAAATGGK